ncbi:MAG: TetR/AcrR family transcriptional regulator [Thermodesulfobacteriota bacterium]
MKIVDTRGKIISAAKELFAEKGYSATSIREIAKKSGLSLGNFYNYFKNKEELFKQTIDPENIVKSLSKIPPLLNAGFPENFDKIILEIKKVVDMNQDLYRLILIDLIEFGGFNTDRIMNRLMEFSGSVFHGEVKEKLVGTKIKKLDYPFYLKYFVSSIIPLFIINNILPSAEFKEYDDEKIAFLISDVLANGIKL